MRSSSPNIAAGSLQVDDPVVIMYHPFLPEGELVSRAGEIGTLTNVSAIEVKGNSFSLKKKISLSLSLSYPLSPSSSSFGFVQFLRERERETA